MCALFGWLDYKHIIPYKVLKKLTQALANAAEERGTDATGISYIRDGQVVIYKRPKPAHKIRFNAPDGITAIMGHTRLTTQGNQKFNQNNHPFPGHADKEFSFAHNTRVKMVYSVKTNWDYIDFKIYSPDDTKELVDYIKTANENNIKSLIYINDINKGKSIQEALDNTQHVYSDDDKRKDIAEIAKNEKFTDKNLITTKVAENGISLHDDELNLIVVETLDLITLQQVIGRARVNRKKPRKITVLIPDYSYTDIGNAIASISVQLKKAKEAAENPDNALEHADEYPALVYYDSKAKKPVVNSMAIKSLEYQLNFLKELRGEKETVHAFAQKVLETYDKSTVITDDMFLSYDRITDFKSKVSSAFDEYMNSEKNAEALDKLKAALKNACNSTKIYNDGKTISSNIQLSTVNDILKSAGIEFEIKPKIEIYGVSAV